MAYILRITIPFSPVYWNLYVGNRFIAEFRTKRAAEAARDAHNATTC